MTIHTTGVYVLAPEHEEAIQRLASDAPIAASTRIPHPYPAGGARDFIARASDPDSATVPCLPCPRRSR